MPSNKFFPGLSAENYTDAPTHGTITHVTFHRVTGLVTAIGLDNERLDDSLGQQHAVPLGLVPEIGKSLAGVSVDRNAFSGGAI